MVKYIAIIRSSKLWQECPETVHVNTLAKFQISRPTKSQKCMDLNYYFVKKTNYLYTLSRAPSSNLNNS